MFQRIRTAPLTEPVASADACIYLYRVFKLIGWMPPQKRRSLYWCWTMFTFIFSTGYLPWSFVISYVQNIKQFTPGDFLTSLQVCINAYGSSVKVAITYSNLGRLHKARALLDKMDARCTLKSEALKIRKAVAFSNYTFYIFTIVYCVYAGSTFLSAVLSGHPPWRLYLPLLDWRNGVLDLWLASCTEYFIMSIAVMQDQLSDTYPLVFVIILRAHMDILKERVENLRTDSQKTDDESYEELVQCIMDHKLILEYVELLRPVISGTIFVQFLLIGLVLGLTLINVMFFSDLWSGIASFFFVVTILLQTFPFCYICNMLLEDCENLTQAIFQSNWVDAEHRYKTTVLHFLHNVQQPIVFSAMGIFDICMNSNISVAKFAFSVITIAKQMNLAEKFT